MCRVVFATLVANLVLATYARAQTILTFEEAIARAREQSGSAAVARARVAEVEAGLIDASARLRDNPIIEGSAGPRTGNGGERFTDVGIAFSQQFETGGQRRARIAGAQAAIDRQRADADDVRRAAVYAAAGAFLDGLAAGERLRIAEEGDSVSRQLLNVTERRYALGDIAAIDVNLARVDAARSAAGLRSARADFAAAVGGLRTILRMPGDERLELRGALDLSAPPSLDGLRGVLDERPEFAALRAEGRAADAQIQLGRALLRPDLSVRLAYEREEADTVVLGGLTITLPAFQRGHGTVAGGTARGARARLELDVARQAAMSELETAYAVYQQRASLAAALAAEALPTLNDTLALAGRSYEAGELSLMELLLIRRDALETRTAVVDRRLDAARSRVAVDYVAGVLR
jgi:cobalt-zinc-cadmium efflux system outer membrane protein